MKKRILALVMSMLLIVCSILTLASCKNNEDDENKGGNLDVEYLDDIGEQNLNGYTVKFAVAEAREDTTNGFNKRSIVADADTGDKVDAAINTRNKLIEQRFNCKIEVKFSDNENLADTISNVLLSGGNDYDIFAGRQYDDVILCSKGYLVDLASLEGTENDFIDWDREYWGTEYIEGMSYQNKVYWLAGDLNLRYMGGFYGVFVNATIYDDYLLENENYGDIHQIVTDYKWTVDMMREMSDIVTNVENVTAGDIDGNEIIGVACPIHDNTNGWAVSCGVQFSTTDKNGNVTFRFNQSNTRLSQFYSEYMELINSKGCVNFSGTDEYGGYIPALEVFASNNALFVPGRINQAELHLRTMTGDFYIIPNPMLNADQKQYISSLHDAISLYGINKNSDNIKASAIVLEALCAETRRTVRTEYYDYALKNKYTTDQNTAAMIDIISSNAYSDFVLVWAFTSYFEGLGSFLRTEMRAGTADLATSLRQTGSVWSATGMKGVREAFAKLEA